MATLDKGVFANCVSLQTIEQLDANNTKLSKIESAALSGCSSLKITFKLRLADGSAAKWDPYDHAFTHINKKEKREKQGCGGWIASIIFWLFILWLIGSI